MYLEDSKMKKVLALAVAMLLIPFTAFGLEMMTDGDMASITGQSGVAISLDNVQVYQETGGRELWFETKLGADGSGAAAAIGLVYSEGSAQYLFLNKVPNPAALIEGGSLLGTVSPVSGPTNRLLRGNYDPLAAMAGEVMRQGMRLAPSVLSIRVAQNNAFSVFGNIVPAGGPFAASSYVEIGLPTLEIVGVRGNQQALQIFIVGDAAYPVGTNLGPIGVGSIATNGYYSVGTLYTTDAGTTTTIMGGRLGIAPLGSIPQAATSSALDNSMGETAPW
ncbi:MAG: hypothetical protein C4548_14275 [Desulfobacteraceae bacterium]|nr:MAG: hypothetical protein C4548_14275 [Desulfobacteraceae bacterium]